MFQVNHLNIYHEKDLQPLLEQFDLILNQGDKIAIIGEEGNGKSTLLEILAGRSPSYVTVTGQRSLPKRIGYLPQSPEEDMLSQPLAKLFETDDYKLLYTLAAEADFPVKFLTEKRKLSTLSGGERIKAQLTAILLRRPELLCLDEPSNDLDLSALVWMERLILRVRIPVLFVSHDETLISRTANGVIHLEQLRGRSVPRHTVAKLPYEAYIRQRAELFAKQTQCAEKERANFRLKEEKFRRIFQRVEFEQNAISRSDPGGGRLLKKKMHAIKSQERRMEREQDALTPMPESEEHIMAFFAPARLPAGKEILRLALPRLTVGEIMLSEQIELTATGRQKIGIIGKNGAGKSTLLRNIAKILLPRKDIRVGYMPQQYAEALPAEKTPVEYLARSYDKAETTRLCTLLGSMKFTPEEMTHPIRALSGGQRAKLCFLKLIYDECNVLLLDEPTRNLSPFSAPVVRKMLVDFDGCIISVSHDRAFLREVTDTVYELTPKGLRPVEAHTLF